MRMNIATDYYIVWGLRIAIALYCINQLIPLLDGLARRLKR